MLHAARNGNGSDDERTRHLVLAVRRDLLTELRSQEREQARRQLVSAAESSEDAVTGVVHLRVRDGACGHTVESGPMESRSRRSALKLA